jgi:hypothetical protein
MAFIRNQLSLVASGGQGKVWTYWTADPVATVQAANYFLTVFSDLVPGDLIHVRAVVGGTESHFDASVLVSNSTTVTLLKSVVYT